jgi:hypothetical protein
MRHSAALAAAALALAALGPAYPAAAARPTHVAIVIAGHGVACVSWHSGITGDEILNDVATVKYRPSDGLITSIDGTPKNNVADETHYWSYWHNTGAGWAYSTVGASAYQPKAGTVEGWRFINGSSTASPPRTRSYASICQSTAVVAPAPSARPSQPVRTAAAPKSTAAARSAASTATHLRTPETGGGGAARTGGAGGTTPAGTNTRRSTGPATSSRPAASSSQAGATGAASTAGPPTLALRNAADATRQRGAGSALPTVLVLVTVLVLGGAAAFVALRRRRSA